MPAFQEYFDPSHQLVRDSVRRFVEREILPDIDQWEEAESFPRELYQKAGAAGILGIGYPEALGGSHEGDLFAKVAASEELMRCGSGGLVAGLGSLDIGLAQASPCRNGTALEVSREFTYRQAAKMAAGQSVIKEISMAKNFATDTADRITTDAVQILGGLGARVWWSGCTAITVFCRSAAERGK